LNTIVVAGALLTNAQLLEVRDALISAYYKWEQLDELVAVALDFDLEAEIGRNGPLKETARSLLKFTEAAGTTEMLLREAVHRRPGNPKLAAVAHMLGLAPAPFTNVRLRGGGRGGAGSGGEGPAGAGSVDAGASSKSLLGKSAALDSDGYEAILRPGGTETPGRWRLTMIERERPVCQILLDDNPVGTGFLIGPDLVMSNHHVFEDAGGKLRLQLEPFSVRFDYRASDPQNVFSPGKIVAIDTAAGYLDKSPKAELDYVIIRLRERSGEDPMPGDKARGWLELQDEILKEHDPAFVLQHPLGRTLELAVGSIIGWEKERIDEIYEHCANTDNGSSGSPCFSWNWDLRALHHRVDPKTGRVNRAIATAAILARMGAMGTIALLP
jgi:hypothetical protein